MNTANPATSVASANGAGLVAVRRYALTLLTLVYVLNFVDRQILAILLPAIKEEFLVGDAVLGALSGTAFALFYVTLGVPIARLADRVNRRNLISAAIGVWSLMTAVCGLAANIWHLALARIGVGVGEAGLSPPAYSMIADYYPPEKRAGAMGIYSLGISIGILLAYLAGGWIAQNIGWREAFFIVGLPGILLALVFRFTVREPARGASENIHDESAQPAMGDVLRALWRRRSFIHMSTGAGLSTFVAYAVINFTPSFVVRSFDASIVQLGLYLGLIFGIGSGLAYFLGGRMADSLGGQGHGRTLRVIAWSMLASVLFFAFTYGATSVQLSVASLFIPFMVQNVYLAPVLALVQGLVSLGMRAVAGAVFLLIVNSIGLALGPLLTGALSDALAPSFGAESMRYALLAVCTLIMPWSAWHFWRASRTIESDLESARR
ncbi:Predicted arabinose efflux permease, MFS family [Microbulbifer donghaiensis]|uniref:Predicted arabinose efflux permease, MFS family n=1 Tax=Microbulbifer donghaiensis TaxID=494016 RepID=A0A1M5E7Y2_9GAMM|nr:MFS transporter [Microbulbifer donghaiensis]SHF75358.1 Predicted arabinose efflux permease, MFS family [Microbulbifer donghaiensis]